MAVDRGRLAPVWGPLQIVGAATVCFASGYALATRLGSYRRQTRSRLSFVMSVHKGRETEYERRHRPIWKELHQELKRHGFHNYSIFLHPKTNQLFGYAEVDDVDIAQRISQTPICQKWWQFMADIMPANTDRSPVSEELQEVFHID